MYAIYGNIYHQYTPNVSINLPYMDSMGVIYIVITDPIQTCVVGLYLSSSLGNVLEHWQKSSRP